jgi:hypothetical protein
VATLSERIAARITIAERWGDACTITHRGTDGRAYACIRLARHYGPHYGRNAAGTLVPASSSPLLPARDLTGAVFS